MEYKNYILALVLSLSTVMIFLCCSSTIFAQQIDPTRPFMQRGINTPQAIIFNKLTLQSIIKQNLEKNAIISNKLLKVGDKIGEYTLQQINTNSVILKSADKQIELTLFSDVMAKSK